MYFHVFMGFGVFEFLKYFKLRLFIKLRLLTNWNFEKEQNKNTLNPIPAGVLENQEMLGGGQFDPPSKSHVLCPNMTNDTSLESSCALLLESVKNLQICKNWIFDRKIQLYSKNVCKKFFSKKKYYTFLKSPWPCHFKYANIFAKF